MRAITLMQPWASLVAVGAKRYETRSWKTNYRGPLAIHSSLKFPHSAQALCRAEPFASALLGNTDLPLGCVVAICDLAAVFSTSTDDSLFGAATEWPSSELPFGDFGPGRFAWLLTNVRSLENPIPARGTLSLWEWDETALGLLHDCDTNHMKKKNHAPHPQQYRQGDIIIERVSELPKDLKPRELENGRLILAHGEVTGHAHEVTPVKLVSQHDINEALRLLGDGDGAEVMTQAALIVKKGVAVIHDEHARIELPPGKYIVRRQREYTPEAIRNVAD